MPLSPGTRLGPFEILSRLGAGGMGEVWRARDTRLQREVAIKVLPSALAGDAERLARFDREARLLASMNHPRIGGLLGLEDAAGVPALVLELIEGPTLAEHLARRGALPPREALTLALQIAEAMEYAHERGIVHRDLKPANVKFTADDSLKVLDFGLAKALLGDEVAEGDVGQSHSPTVTLGTHVGTLLGTAAYMAPEQARGKPVDRRADIWAFGVVLFEMLAGRPLFGGETVSDTIARILERQPDWSLLPPGTPERVRELLARCLHKDARQRLRDIGDARHELETALREIESGVVPPRAGARPARGLPAWVAPAAALAVVAAFAAGFALRGGRGAAPAPVVRTTLVPPPELLARNVIPAPDADAFYTRAGWRAEPGQPATPSRIYRRALDDFTWRPLAGTEGATSYDLAADGRWVYFVAPVAPGSARLGLSRVAVDGSAPPTALTPWDSNWQAWEALPGERFVVISVRRDSLGLLEPARGSGPAWRPLKKNFEVQTLDLTATLPGGRACVGSVGYFSPTGWTVDAVVLDLEKAELRILLPNSVAQGLLPGDLLLLTRGPAMLASGFDLSGLKLSGAPITVLDGMRVDNSWGHGRAGLSARGDLAYPGGVVDPGRRRLAVLMPDGRWEDWNGEVGPFEKAPALSPDGRVAIITTVPPGSSSYELVVLVRGQRGARRLVAEPGEDCTAPAIAPDGRRVAFMRQGVAARAGVYEMPLDGSAAPRLLLAAADGARAYDFPTGWTPDGRSLLLQSTEAGRGSLRLFTPGAGAPRELNASRRNAWAPAVSPDGTRLAFLSDEAGAPEVRVAALRPDGTLGPSVQVANMEATSVLWRREGDGLVFTTPDKMLMECRIGPDLAPSAPAPRASLVEHIGAGDDYALLPGGAIVVTHLAENEGYVRQFNLVLGFAGEVERRVAEARH